MRQSGCLPAGFGLAHHALAANLCGFFFFFFLFFCHLNFHNPLISTSFSLLSVRGSKYGCFSGTFLVLYSSFFLLFIFFLMAWTEIFFSFSLLSRLWPVCPSVACTLSGRTSKSLFEERRSRQLIDVNASPEVCLV